MGLVEEKIPKGLVGEMEKWIDRKWGVDRKDLVFSHLCLVGKMEKWKNEKLICLVDKKNERLEKWSWYRFIIMTPLNKTKKSHIFK